MAADSLSICIAFTLMCISAGTWLLKVAQQFKLEAVRTGQSGEYHKMMMCDRHGHNFELLAIVLLFASWMPCSNAAWISDAQLSKLQHRHHKSQLAETVESGSAQSSWAQDSLSVARTQVNVVRHQVQKALESRQ